MDSKPTSLSPLRKPRERQLSLGKVTFAEGQITPEHSGDIVVKKIDDENRVEAHIGMLSEFHKYDIRIEVPFYVGDQLQVAREHAYLSMRGLKADTEKTRQVFTLSYTAAKQGPQIERIVFRKGDTPETFTIDVHVTVIGKGKGTPLLKTGIHCNGVDSSLDSTAETSQAEENGQ